MNDVHTMRDFAGRWLVEEARLPNGKEAYTGEIVVRLRGSVYEFEWAISAGRYVGLGIPWGDHLYVTCGEQWAGLGIVLLINTHDLIKVSWCTSELGGEISSGSIVPVGDGVEGQHDLMFFFPDGSEYGRWKLIIERNNAVYKAAWQRSEAIHWRGLGLDMHDPGIALGWYPDVNQLAFLDYSFDPVDTHRLKAVWALGEFGALGTETLVRV